MTETGAQDAGGEPEAVIVLGAPGAGSGALARALAALRGAVPWEPPGTGPSQPAGPDGDRLLAGAEAELGHPHGEGVPIAGAPRFSLQVPFLAERLPGAKFIFCWRTPREAMAAAYRAWARGSMPSNRSLEEWQGPAWCFALVPGWDELAGADLGTIVVEQWERVTRIGIDDLAELAPGSWGVTTHAALRADPAAELGRLSGFLGLDGGGLRVAAEQLRNELEDELPIEDLPEDLTTAMPRAAATAQRAQGWLATPRRAVGANADPASTGSPLRSVHTGSVPDLLGQLGASLLISTYQAGKLILARKDGIRLNTHFRNFDQPMGLALDRGRLAIGTRSAVIEYRNMPAAAAKVEPRGTHDACFIHRNTRVTGDVRIHDVAWIGDELWFVATAFSCLATLDPEHNFSPRWTPPFVKRVAPGDHCHLNGMEVIDGRVAWATALGQTDEPGGWRKNKASGGCLIDVGANEVVLEELSMPHSPRWHDGRLWFLESGQGRLCVADPEAGTYETVQELPGFTRGLDFAGPLAFVGLSQIRETATFGGLPIGERLSERQCGVWIVDTRTGNIAGFLRFEEAVQEVYDVLALVGMRKPEVAEQASEITRNSFVIEGWED